MTTPVFYKIQFLTYKSESRYRVRTYVENAGPHIPLHMILEFFHLAILVKELQRTSSSLLLYFRI